MGDGGCFKWNGTLLPSRSNSLPVNCNLEVAKLCNLLRNVLFLINSLVRSGINFGLLWGGRRITGYLQALCRKLYFWRSVNKIIYKVKYNLVPVVRSITQCFYILVKNKNADGHLLKNWFWVKFYENKFLLKSRPGNFQREKDFYYNARPLGLLHSYGDTNFSNLFDGYFQLAFMTCYSSNSRSAENKLSRFLAHLTRYLAWTASMNFLLPLFPGEAFRLQISLIVIPQGIYPALGLLLILPLAGPFLPSHTFTISTLIGRSR